MTQKPRRQLDMDDLVNGIRTLIHQDDMPENMDSGNDKRNIARELKQSMKDRERTDRK